MQMLQVLNPVLLVALGLRTPQLVCILCTLKTKPNGCLQAEYQPNQTSDSDLTYNNTLQLQEANVEVVIHNVEGDEKIDIIMT